MPYNRRTGRWYPARRNNWNNRTSRGYRPWKRRYRSNPNLNWGRYQRRSFNGVVRQRYFDGQNYGPWG